jgi:hypothetical protein
MPLEEAQMLCTVLWHHAPEYAEEQDLYKPVHQKHPCTLWAMQTRANYRYAYDLYTCMLVEYTHRYDKIHGASKHKNALFFGSSYVPEGEQTPHPQCFSGLDHLKTDEFYPIKAYREFYKADKLKFARYSKGRSMPEWMAA